jgi:eukaryotic-like serine/threonine-protein kinase
MSRPQRHSRPDATGAIKALELRNLALGGVLGKYRLIGALGHGGMADVYLAIADGPEGFRKLCVVKTLKSSMAQDEDFRTMFLDEARLAARLNHPNVVQTFEVDDSEGRLLLAMEYIEGQPMSRARKRLAPEQFPLTAYIRALCEVLDALEYSHNLCDFDGSSLGIVHRDVSPHNVMVGYDGRVKLVDFGIAKSAAAVQMTQAGVLKGKVSYMAPEQAVLANLDGRADVFSVGVMLWEAIAGKRLGEGLSAHDVLVRRIEGKDPPIAAVVPDVDPELASICDRAMAKPLGRRFASAAEMQAELERWLNQHGEPPRKAWAKELKAAFAPERQQLRDIVEATMPSDASSSGMRHSLLSVTASNAANREEELPLSQPNGCEGTPDIGPRSPSPSRPSAGPATVIYPVTPASAPTVPGVHKLPLAVATVALAMGMMGAIVFGSRENPSAPPSSRQDPTDTSSTASQPGSSSAGFVAPLASLSAAPQPQPVRIAPGPHAAGHAAYYATPKPKPSSAPPTSGPTAVLPQPPTSSVMSAAPRRLDDKDPYAS